MKRKDFLKNIVTGFVGQLIAIVMGMIIPRIMISSYGSDVNGVVSTTVQVFSYLALLEAGIGQSARIALYKPIADRDNEKISMIFLSAESYFRRITLYYGIGVIVISLIVPYIMKSDMPHLTILSVFFLEGMSGVISFYYVQTPTILLNVDGKGYINNYVTLSNKIIGYLAKITLASLGVSIVIVQFSFFIITVLKVVFYRVYVKKKYFWIARRKTPDMNLLKDKNSYLITEIAWTIFSSTDMMVLSFFVSTKLSSVYSIYSLIYGSINLLLNAVGGSILYILGQIYYKNRNQYEEVHDAMNTIFIGTTTILMSVSYVLIIPFVRLYTKGVADVDYVYDQLPLMFSLVQLLSWSRYVNGNLTGLAGYAKSTSYISLAEAVINMVLSIVLVQKYGITGVLFATVIALPIKVIWCIYISDKKVLHRSLAKTIQMISCNYGFFFGIVLIMKHVNLEIPTYSMFAMYGCALVIIIGTLGVGLNILTNRGCLYIAKRIFFKG